jgi:hypothetical protein
VKLNKKRLAIVKKIFEISRFFALKLKIHMINNLSLNDYLLTHCNESMEQALAAERHPVWQRSCP